MPAIPLRGDRSAWDVSNYPELHSSDLENSTPIYHVPAPTGVGAYLYSSDGVSWASVTSGAPSIFSSITVTGSATIAKLYVTGSATIAKLYVSSSAVLEKEEVTGLTTLNQLNVTGSTTFISGSNTFITGSVVIAGSAKIREINVTASTTLNNLNVTGNATLNNLTITGSFTSTTSLNNLTDVHTPSPQDGDMLMWSTSSGSWVAYPVIDWRVALSEDTSSDDSDKLFTVPSSTEWQILWIWVEYTTTATAGNRQLEIQIQDVSSNVISQFQTGLTQAENLTYKYLFGIGVQDLTSLRDGNYLTTPLPAGTFLSTGQKIRVWDNNAVDSSGDDMIIKIQYAYRILRVDNYYVLIMKNSSHTQTSDKISTLTRHQVLATSSSNNSTHTHTAQKVSLSGRYAALLVENPAHIQTSENVSLPMQTYSISINNSSQAQTSENTAFTQYHVLGMNNSRMKMIGQSVILSIVQRFNIVVNNSAHTQSSGNTSLTFYSGLIVQNSSQLHTADNVNIETSIKILETNNSLQLQTSNNISTSTDKATLYVNNSGQVQTSESAKAITNIIILVMDNSIIYHTSEKLILTQYQAALKVNNSSMKHVPQNVILTGI